MSSPISSWEGATAYFTSANSGGVLMFWLALSVVAVVAAIVHTSLHEDKSATVVRNNGHH